MPRPTPKRPPAHPDSSDTAVRWFRDRLMMTDEEFIALEEATHATSFTIAGVNQLDLVEEVWSALDLAIENGETLGDFQARVSDRLASAWGGDEPWRVENIFRTNAQSAYAAGRFVQMNDPAVRAARPYWRFSSILDSRTTQVCSDCDNVIRPASDPWWDGHYAPLHFQCVLPGVKVSAAGVSAWYARRFEGEIVRILVEGHDELAVTPNHPVLTTRGWVPAGELRESDYMIESSAPGVAVASVDPHDHHVETSIEEIADALRVAGRVRTARVPVTAEDFHGDAAVGYEVHIVRPERALKRDGKAASAESERDVHLPAAHQDGEVALPGGGDLGEVLGGLRLPTARGVCRCREPKPVLSGGPGHSDHHRLAPVAQSKPEAAEPVPDGRGAAPELPGETDRRLAGHVAPVKIARLVFGENWAGHVFNLETDGGWYFASGMIVHNCRSHVVTLSEEEAQDEGITPDPPRTPAAEGFGQAPASGGDDSEPDLAEYPPALAREYGT